MMKHTVVEIREVQANSLSDALSRVRLEQKKNIQPTRCLVVGDKMMRVQEKGKAAVVQPVSPRPQQAVEQAIPKTRRRMVVLDDTLMATVVRALDVWDDMIAQGDATRDAETEPNVAAIRGIAAQQLRQEAAPDA